MNVNPAGTPQTVLIAALAYLAIEVVKRLLTRNRKKEKVDAAARVEEAALALLAPMRERIHELDEEAGQLRDMVRQLRDEGNEILEWARMAKRELDIRGVTVAPIPIRRGAAS